MRRAPRSRSAETRHDDCVPALMRTVLAWALVAVGSGLAVVPGAALAADPVSEETVAYFRQNCTSCHTIGGGKLVGPDLKDATKRRDREQLARFILDPKAAIDAGDEYLRKLFASVNNVYMTTPLGMTRDRIAKLLDLVEQESALEKSQFQGLQISDRPLTAEDVARGRSLFLGEERIASGAPPCMSCHTVRGAPGFGGGRLGPDLTEVYARLEGRRALSAWLSAPPGAMMTPIFKPTGTPLASDEILSLVAFLKDCAEKGVGKPAESGVFEYLVAGVAGLVGILVAFDWIWRNRFRGVRSAMVAGRGAGGARSEGAGR
jgi:mono/diheme cytochrome c family protein